VREIMLRETVRVTQWERHSERDHVERDGQGETVRETQWERGEGDVAGETVRETQWERR
jgi:hypothetical protein